MGANRQQPAINQPWRNADLLDKSNVWRGGRVVECTALEMRHTGNRIGGSNPSLSAKPTPSPLP